MEAKKPAKKATKKAAKTAKVSTRPPAPPEDDLQLPTGEGADLIPVSLLVRYNLFVTHYLDTLDCAAAAKVAGWEGKNHAAQKAMGGQLLRNPYIRTAIERQYRAIIAKTGATVERIWEEISYQAFLDPAVFYDERGDVRPMSEIPEAARRAITGMKVKEGTIGEDGSFVERELKFASKDAGLDKLMRLHRMVDNDKMVLVGGEEFVQAMEEGRQRAARGS